MFSGSGEMNGMYRHGMSRTAIYETWKSMRARCNNVNNPAYKNYGGRGIRVCKRWDTFNNFFSDMGNAPSGKTLDRKNNNLGYSKANCRWATRMQQSANSRLLRVVVYKGKKYHITEFCRSFRISYGTIRSRLQRGWEVHRAINQPIGKYDHHHT